ncbi:MAG TPA: metalloregulator ArsR/SmtB family transcription factor [Pseudolabrys sp.]|nr:metalloregulator ArsR/SmtB family transcription factor [Pseudolabrys sp.]
MKTATTTRKKRRNPRLCRSIGEASDLLKALANPNRLSIVCMLLEGERSVAAIESELGIRQPTLSQQLGELREAGLVATRRDAKHIYYRVVDDRAGQIVKTLRIAFTQLEDWCEALPSPSDSPGLGGLAM